MPELERVQPPYMQIAADIRARIKSGELQNGSAVPSARQLTRDWGVAMATAMKALALLQSEGLVRAIPGVGSVVHSADSLHLAAHDRIMAVNKTGRIYPPGHFAKIRSATLVSASEIVGGSLGVDVGQEVIRRQRTTYSAANEPISTSVSWYSGTLASIAPLLLRVGRIEQGTSKYVEEMTGRTVIATHVQHAASSAGVEVAQELQVAPGSPVLISRNRFLDSDGNVIEFGESTARADSWVFYEYTTGAS